MITAVPQKEKQKDRDNVRQHEEYMEIYSKLQQFVSSIDSRLVNKIQSIQQNFAGEYKEAVRTMNEELQEIRNRLDAANLKHNANQRLKALEQERDYFREMSRQLDIDLKASNTRSRQRKSRIQDMETELQGYKQTCFRLEMEADKFRSAGGIPNKTSRTNQRHPQIKQEDSKKANANSLPKNKQFLSQTQTAIKRSRSTTFYKSERQIWGINPPAPNPLVSNPQPLRECQEILADCIKSLKKDIFYRTTSSTTGVYNHFYQDQTIVPFQKFTLTDKKELIRLFIKDPKVLQRLYSLVFSAGEQKEKSIRPFDSSFNHNNLQLIKRKFQDRLASTKLGSLRKQ